MAEPKIKEVKKILFDFIMDDGTNGKLIVDIDKGVIDQSEVSFIIDHDIENGNTATLKFNYLSMNIAMIDGNESVVL